MLLFIYVFCLVGWLVGWLVVFVVAVVFFHPLFVFVLGGVGGGGEKGLLIFHVSPIICGAV